MTSNEEPFITTELQKTQIDEIATIYSRAFPLKFKHIWLFTTNETYTHNFLKQSIRPKYGFFAVKNSKVVGFLGMDFGGSKRFISYRFPELSETFGYFGGLWRYVLESFLYLFVYHPKASEIRIDPIAVVDEERDKGIGTTLLQNLFAYAKQNGKRKVLLEVVDTNTNAQHLYEKMGFVLEKTVWGVITGRAGFKKLHYMSKTIT